LDRPFISTREPHILSTLHLKKYVKLKLNLSSTTEVRTRKEKEKKRREKEKENEEPLLDWPLIYSRQLVGDFVEGHSSIKRADSRTDSETREQGWGCSRAHIQKKKRHLHMKNKQTKAKQKEETTEPDHTKPSKPTSYYFLHSAAPMWF